MDLNSLDKQKQLLLFKNVVWGGCFATLSAGFEGTEVSLFALHSISVMEYLSNKDRPNLKLQADAAVQECPIE